MHAEPGTLIDGKYEILAPLGQGGMGSVFRARHVLTEQRVALKVLRVGPGDEAVARRFKLEVSVAAKVEHPGIVKVFDAGTEPENERFYLAMELLEGRSLRDVMADDPPDVKAVVGHLADALGVMAAAHARGVVHRDLKPDNLFVQDTEDGARLRVLDFGIARDLAGPSLTTTGVAVGTALYMAPEQGTASRELSPAVDVWAIGVMLYEAITGRVPFDGASAHAVVIEAVTTPHRPLEDLRPDLPPEWSALLDRCLAKRPEERPETEELHAAVRTLHAASGSLDPAIPLARRVRTGPMMGLKDTEAAADHNPVRPAPSEVESIPAPPRPPVSSRGPQMALLAAGALGAAALIWFVATPSAQPEHAPAVSDPEPLVPITTEPSPEPDDPPPEEPSPAPAPHDPVPVAQPPSPRSRRAPDPVREPARERTPPPAEVEPAPAAAPQPAPVATPTPAPEPDPEPEPTPAPEPAPATTRPAATSGTGVFEDDDAFESDLRRRRR